MQWELSILIWLTLVCLDMYELTLAWLSLLTSIYMGFIAAVNVCKVGKEPSAIRVSALHWLNLVCLDLCELTWIKLVYSGLLGLV